MIYHFCTLWVFHLTLHKTKFHSIPLKHSCPSFKIINHIKSTSRGYWEIFFIGLFHNKEKRYSHNATCDLRTHRNVEFSLIYHCMLDLIILSQDAVTSYYIYSITISNLIPVVMVIYRLLRLTYRMWVFKE
jgi:hypothetical protein